jgi:hypothetical protein
MSSNSEHEVKYQHALEFEHELINRRIGWLFTSQTLLLSVYGIVLTLKPDAGNGKYENIQALFVKTLPGIAISICSFIFIAIIAAFCAKYYSREAYRKTLEEQERKKVQLGVKNWITFIGFVPEFSLPLIFIFFWMRFLSVYHDIHLLQS